MRVEAQHDSERYIKIRLNSIHPEVPVTFDIYVIINSHYVHYLRAGDRLKREKIDKFELKAPDQFFVSEEDHGKYKLYIQGILSSERIPPDEKAVILKESAFSLVEDLFEAEQIQDAIAESKKVVRDFIGLMEEDSSAMAALIGLSSHDFYTYNHSLDVCIYSLGLGHIAGYRDKELHELGQGALFHDIGKRYVDIGIITKEGPLNESEWDMMRKHPLYGLKILDTHKASEVIKACCLEHHESRQGDGYPQGLTDQEIHPAARIVSICDTYDALTTQRSYNAPMTPTDAIGFMKEKLAKRFDEDLLKAMAFCLYQMRQRQAG